MNNESQQRKIKQRSKCVICNWLGRKAVGITVWVLKTTWIGHTCKTHNESLLHWCKATSKDNWKTENHIGGVGSQQTKCISRYGFINEESQRTKNLCTLYKKPTIFYVNSFYLRVLCIPRSLTKYKILMKIHSKFDSISSVLYWMVKSRIHLKFTVQQVKNNTYAIHL